MVEPKMKGELGDIRTQLQNIMRAGNKPEVQGKRREVFRRMINYMSMGMDMSPLFMDCVKHAASTNDLVIRKMMYLYLSNYAKSNPELALLTINILLKDCNNPDPTVRSLALRSLTNLRVANLAQYLAVPLRQGLQDQSPFVRRTAVLGVLKLARLRREAVQDYGLLETVKTLLTTDPDAQVISNCLLVLQSIPGCAPKPNKSLVYALLNRIRDFSEWSQCLALDFVARYTPESEKEVFDILNALEDRMQHANSAVVMAAAKIFLLLTLPMVSTHQEVLERVKAPLLTHATSSTPETAYAVLSHLRLLAHRAPVLFCGSYKSFFCRYNDPSYVKSVKLDILCAIADSSNAFDIVTEICEYVADVNVELSKEGVRAVGFIAQSVPDTSGLVERLLSFLDMGRQHVVAEVIKQLPDIVRRYPESVDLVVNTAVTVDLAQVSDPDARAAFIWLLGTHGQALRNTPYVLEVAVEQFASESISGKLALLTSCARVFFRRPHEMKPTLGAALAAGASDPSRVVAERAVMYHRLLRQGVDEAEKIIAAAVPQGSHFLDEESDEVRDRIFAEFNTLAVPYAAPSSTFATEAFEARSGAGAGGAGSAAGAPHAAPRTGPAHGYDEGPEEDLLGASDDLLLSDADRAEAAGTEVPAGQGGAAKGSKLGPIDLEELLGGFGGGPDAGAGDGGAAALAGGMGNPGGGRQAFLGSLDDMELLLGGGGAGGAPVSMGVPAAAPAATGGLVPGPAMGREAFQAAWAQAAGSDATVEVAVDPVATLAVATEPQRVSAACAAKGLTLVERGGDFPVFRLMLHSRGQGGSQAYCEALVDANYGTAKVHVRTVPPGSLPTATVAAALKNAFAELAAS